MSRRCRVCSERSVSWRRNCLVGEIRDRLEKMKRLVELRERLERVAEGEDAGLLAVQAEGRRIVEERERQLADPERAAEEERARFEKMRRIEAGSRRESGDESEEPS